MDAEMKKEKDEGMRGCRAGERKGRRREGKKRWQDMGKLPAVRRCQEVAAEAERGAGLRGADAGG